MHDTIIFSSTAQKRKSKNGFTLIELLVVIAIIGLLASIVLVSLNKARAKARETRRLSDLRQIQLALEMYYDDYGYYPRELSDSANGKVGEGAGIDNILTSGGYMTAIPSDPLGPGNSTYYYYYDGWHNCLDVLGSCCSAVLFAKTMENSDNANWSTVCFGPGSEGGPGTNTYMIVLGFQDSQ